MNDHDGPEVQAGPVVKVARDRCDYSELMPEHCAHCQGHGASLPDGDALHFPDEQRGRTVWPLPHVAPTRRHIAPPEEPTDDPRVQVARDLRAIIRMAAMLGDRAEDLAGDPVIPGGDAMVNLAHLGNLEAWENRNNTTERLGLAYTSVADEDPEQAWSAFQTLDYWSEQWRDALDMDYGRQATISSEANFLANADVLAWAWGNTQGAEWSDFADDMSSARSKLENIVRDGIRETRSRIMCDRCKEPKRLIRKWAKGDRPDMWKAPCCKAELTDNEAKRAHARQMRSAGAERWVEVNEAVGALRVQGWQERTVRRWLEPIRHDRDLCDECGQKWPAREYATCPADDGACGGLLVPVWGGNREAVVIAWCDPVKHRTFVWWPDLWQRHLLATHRREARLLDRVTAV